MPTTQTCPECRRTWDYTPMRSMCPRCNKKTVVDSGGRRQVNPVTVPPLKDTAEIERDFSNLRDKIKVDRSMNSFDLMKNKLKGGEKQ